MRNLSDYPKRDAGRYRRNTQSFDKYITRENILKGLGVVSALGLAGLSAKYIPFNRIIRRQEHLETAINPS